MLSPSGVSPTESPRTTIADSNGGARPRKISAPPSKIDDAEARRGGGVCVLALLRDLREGEQYQRAQGLDQGRARRDGRE